MRQRKNTLKLSRTSPVKTPLYPHQFYGSCGNPNLSIWNIGITLSAYTVFQSRPCPENSMDGLNLVRSLDIWCTGQCILEPLSVFRNFLQHVQANMLGKISKDWQCKHEKEGRIHGQGLFGYCQSNIEKLHIVFFLTHERVWIISWVWDSRKCKVIKKPNMVHFNPLICEQCFTMSEQHGRRRSEVCVVLYSCGVHVVLTLFFQDIDQFENFGSIFFHTIDLAEHLPCCGSKSTVPSSNNNHGIISIVYCCWRKHR